MTHFSLSLTRPLLETHSNTARIKCMNSIRRFSGEEDNGVEMLSQRAVAFSATVFSTVAVLACVISLPLFYNFMQKTRTLMLDEVEYCRVSV